MTTASSHIRPEEHVEHVDFAVPGGASTGPRFAAWQDAVDHARASITRAEYRGQQLDEEAPEFHPRRAFQEGGTLVSHSRAFVDMRVVTARYGPGGAALTGRSDGVACRWEVFRDGTVEAWPGASSPGPEVPGEEQAAARHLESSGYQILDQGWATTGGRLGIVAADGNTLIVCQVRPRTTGAVISPAARSRLRRLATAWLTARGRQFGNIRLDLALYYTDEGRYAIEHIPGAG
jgi:putative endonuclease